MISPKIDSGLRPHSRQVSLSAHGFEVDISPHLGGRIERACHDGKDILHPRHDIDNPNPLDAGCFPLVPFSNRIRNGRFVFDGIDYQLEHNWTGDQHAIHGEGWKRPWKVISVQPDMALLSLKSGDWWPWSFECHQTIQVKPGRLDLALAMTNTSSAAMPCGLGFHPYFPRRPGTRLGFGASAVWTPMTQDTKLSATPVSGVTDFHKPKPLDGLQFDHCFENWRGSARIDHADGRGSLRIHCPQSPRHCVVFVPESETYFCFEPVSHLTGAFEMDPGAASGLVSLKPGERLDFSMQIELANPAR